MLVCDAAAFVEEVTGRSLDEVVVSPAPLVFATYRKGPRPGTLEIRFPAQYCPEEWAWTTGRCSRCPLDTREARRVACWTCLYDKWWQLLPGYYGCYRTTIRQRKYTILHLRRPGGRLTKSALKRA